MFHHAVPSAHSFGHTFRADQRQGKTTAEIDAIGVLAQTALEIGHGFVRVCDRQHDVVQIGPVDNVHTLKGAVHTLSVGLVTSRQNDQPCNAGGCQREGLAHFCVLYCSCLVYLWLDQVVTRTPPYQLILLIF